MPYLKKSVSLVENAAHAFEKAIPILKNIKNEYGKFLKLDGSYFWRNIAGENVLSAHSFGIAIDLGADHAPYWRWSRKPYHPLQAEYPPEIVEAMERNGFIWGGKWKEYDIMHFEYRPELICKSKILSGRSF